MDQFVLAGDLGGTNLRIAAVDPSGQLHHRVEAETPRHSDESKIIDAVAQLARRCMEQLGTEPKGFGFAIPAIMSAEQGLIFTSPNLPELNGSDLSRQIAGRTGLKVILENDANAAALGEFWLGASRGFENSICITLGTGVGGGIILNRSVFSGPDGTAGEIGHVCVEPEGHPCGCGSRGCLEQYSSASAIVRMAEELRGEFPESRIGSGMVDARTVFELGVEGDPLGREVFRRAGAYLGIALAGLINVLNPDAIVIGGGAASGLDLFIGSLREEVRKRAFRKPAERARIVRAELGNDAGIAGAAYLAFSKTGNPVA